MSSSGRSPSIILRRKHCWSQRWWTSPVSPSRCPRVWKKCSRPIFFHFPNGLKDRSVRQPNDTSQYNRQWYELAACRLPVLRSTAAAAATQHRHRTQQGRSNTGVQTVHGGPEDRVAPRPARQEMDILQILHRGQNKTHGWTPFVANAIWTIGLPAQQRVHLLSPQDLEAVSDAIHNVLNWLDRLAGALQRDRATSEFQDAQRKGGVAHGVSGLSLLQSKRHAQPSA